MGAVNDALRATPTAQVVNVEDESELEVAGKAGVGFAADLLRALATPTWAKGCIYFPGVDRAADGDMVAPCYYSTVSHQTFPMYSPKDFSPAMLQLYGVFQLKNALGVFRALSRYTPKPGEEGAYMAIANRLQAIIDDVLTVDGDN